MVIFDWDWHIPIKVLRAVATHEIIMLNLNVPVLCILAFLHDIHRAGLAAVTAMGMMLGDMELLKFLSPAITLVRGREA
jgi:hypothetical protein